MFYRAGPLDVRRLQAGDDAVAVAFYAADQLPPVPFRTHREVIAKWRARGGVGCRACGGALFDRHKRSRQTRTTQKGINST